MAWDLYLKMDTSGDSFSILQVIANDCYKVIIHPKLRRGCIKQFLVDIRRWDSFIMLLKRLICWNGSRVTPNIGKENAALALAYFR